MNNTQARILLVCGLVAAAAPALGATSDPASLPRLAYVDPGSGSFLIQALAAMLAGAVVALHQYWAKLKNLLGVSGHRRGGAPSASEAGDD